MRQILLLPLAILVLVGMSPAYAQTISEDRPLSIGDRIRFIIEDALESFIPELRQQFGDNLRTQILDDLDNGIVVAQERIDRVQEKIGFESIRELADINELNKLHEEFKEISRLTGEQQRIKAAEFDQKVNRLTIVTQGCERPINTMDILNSDNYYETLRNDFCKKTLEHIDFEKAKSYAGQ